MGHLYGVNLCSYMVAHKEQLGVRVIDDVVNLVGHELMQNGHGNGSIGQRSQKGYSPLAGVATAEGYLVTLHDTTVFKQDVQLLYLTSHIVILQGGSLVVCQRIEIPIVDDALLNQLIKAGYVFHNILFV